MTKEEVPKIPIPVVNPNATEWVPPFVVNYASDIKNDYQPTTINSHPQNDQSKHVTISSLPVSDSPKYMDNDKFSRMYSKESDMFMVTGELNKSKEEIQKFSGDPMDYSRFLRQFHSRIIANTTSFEERLTNLLQYTISEPNRIITGYSHLEAQIGYESALEEFRERYGDSDVIAHAYVRKTLDMPLIRNDNPKALDGYAIFLEECQHAIETVSAAVVLEYSDNLKLLVKKLPFHLHERWRNIVYEIEDKKGTVKFKHLVDFVRKEAKKANDPKLASCTKKPREKVLQPRKNFAAVAENKEAPKLPHSTGNTSANVRMAFNKPCIFCQDSSHAFLKCETILKKDWKERYQFLKSKGLCFACLKSGHNKTSCQHKHPCSCGKIHPTILHVEARQPQVNDVECQNQSGGDLAQVKTGSTYTGAGDMRNQAFPIVSVRVKSQDSDKFIETYAFLDSGSTATFCLEKIMREFNIKGRKTTLNLLTMAHEYINDCYTLTGLEISDLQGNNVIQLPLTYSQEKLPVSSNDIVSVIDLQRWSYLRDIPLQRINDEHIGLLIGVNVPRAMEPWKVVPSVENGPFAVKTLQGWVINGPLDVSAQDNGFVTSNLIGTKVVHVSLEDQVRNHFNWDFSERTIDDVACPSKEDKRFMDIVSNSINIQEGHYVVNLPFKSKDNVMPNNRKQADQRLLSLSRRFDRDNPFRDEYITFMNKVLDNGYASEVSLEDLSRDDGHEWYLPHHGVFHPRKNKIRVVFDCAARFQGTSLNERLLQGPNLTNSLVGTLIRFRQDEIAVMGDIESMFYQVRVPTKDASYLRFLWWKDGNHKIVPTEYQMIVHFFGATSSPSCVNYALRRTAEDCRGQFNDEVIDTVLCNFYVDDCLKSVRNVSEAVCLVEDLQCLLSRGGFQIAKWISNNREVMRSIPTSDMAIGVKDLDLDQDSLPIDRALGV